MISPLRVTSVSVRSIGFATLWPKRSFRGTIVRVCGTTTSSDFSGTEMTFLQFGQGPFLPANLSLTWNRLKHFGQVTAIGNVARSPRKESSTW